MVTFAVTVLATIAAALCSYRYLELPFIALGKRLTSQRTAPGLAAAPR
jgi:peptidoglycan/LPS O-acetylase OafA/YrhL